MKKLLLFFGLICMINLTFAQEMVTIHQNGHDFPVDATHSGNGHLRWGEFNPTVPQDSILFWTGTGSNRAVIAITWNDAIAGNIGIAWGVQWNGSAVSIRMIMDTIAAYDSRFTVSGNMAISNLSYIDSELGLNLVGPSGWWWYNWKAADGSSYSSQSAAADILSNGDFVDWLPMDPDDWSTYPADLMIMATDPNGGGTPPTPPTPPTPTFTVDDIHYWVGTGDASAIVAVSWEEDEVALAWGVHYDDEWYPSVIDLLDSIKTYDPRFDYHVSYYMSSPYNISSISFTEGNLTLSQTNTSNIMVQVLTSEGETDAISGDELEDYSVWDGDFVQISTTGDFNFSELEAVEPPATPVEPEELCNTIQSLPYSEDFSGYVNDQSVRPYEARTRIPECWTMVSNGNFTHSNTSTSTESIYFGGVAYATNPNSYGCMTPYDPYFCLIAFQQYDGPNASTAQNVSNYGTKKFAILPAFDQPLSQTVLTFNHRCTAHDGAALLIGYITNSTDDFISLDSIPIDYRITHNDTIRFSEMNAIIPDNARLTFCWKSIDTAHTGYPSGYYCGIDNLTVALDEVTPIDTTPVIPVPEEASFAASDVLYWVGEGSNNVVMAINWADTALAWGYRWDGTATVANMMTDIAAADPRFSYTLDNYGYLNDILFAVSDGDTLRKIPFSYWESKNNGFGDAGMAQTLSDGDFEKWAEPAAGIVVDSIAIPIDSVTTYWYYQYVYPMTIYPVSVPVIDTTPVIPVPEEASFAASDVLYWVGEGSNNVVMAINWADTALAWGYRWDGTATVANMMTDIAAADPRFSYTLDNYGYLNDILFAVSDGDTLRKIPFSYWESKNNGFGDAGMAQTLSDGDFEKWAEPAAGIVVDSIAIPIDSVTTYWYYQYVYPMTIYPVSVPVIDTTPVTPVPEEASFAASDVLYWVGEGSNNVVMAINWADTALAWGYRWDGTATVANMMTDIAAADPRFSYTLDNYGYLNDILFAVSDGDTLRKIPFSYWESKNNGIGDAGLAQTLSDGDFEKWAEPAAGIVVDSIAYPIDSVTTYWYYQYVYPMTIYPVSVPVIDTTPVIPVPEEATIAFSDILYWVGEGTNKAVMAVNWADTALAWGYRWNGDATVVNMMDDIAAADPRFSYTLDNYGYLNDILFAVSDGDTLRKIPFSYWESKNNGIGDAGMAQTLSDGDFEKWAEPAAGIVVDSIAYPIDSVTTYWYYQYVYPMTIYPVSVPDTSAPQPQHGPFCGPVGTEGCNAIKADSSIFVAWATNAVVTRGPINIANPALGLASTGSDVNATGPATLNDVFDIVSLGDGGSALLTFELPIRNGEGPDFAVFENDNNGGFLELAFVEVSSDGEHFVRFPATSLTQTETQVGTFGLMDPTFINNLAGKFQIGYGTPFDLEELRDNPEINIDSIVYVRIVDAIGTINPQYATYDAYGHIVNDPWPTPFASCGFDLSGVGVIHQKTVGIEDHDVTHITVYPNPCNDRIYVNLDEVQRVELYNMNGRLLEIIQPDDTHFMLDMQQYPAGLYLLRVGNGVQKIMKR